MQIELLKKLHDKGFSLIPLTAWNEGQNSDAGKLPKLSSWEEYKTKRAGWDTVETWFKTWSGCNWGIVCGDVSGDLVVLDFDDPAVYEKMLPDRAELEQGTLVVKTSRGYHVYLKGKTASKDLRSGDQKLIEIRSDGRYVVAPGSTHKTGAVYEQISSTDKILEVKGDILQVLIEKAEKAGYEITNKPAIDIEKILKGVAHGDRDNSLIHLVAFLRKIGKTQDESLQICNEWNQRNKPPLESSVIGYKVEYHFQKAEPYNYYFVQNPKSYQITENLELIRTSISGKGKGAAGANKATELIKIVENSRCILFHDTNKEPHAKVPMLPGVEAILPLNSAGFKRWLSQRYYELSASAIKKDDIANALLVLEAEAVFDGSMYELHNRVAWENGTICYDLADEDWQAVRITATGWEIIPQTILFRRYGHQIPQVSPDRNGDIRKVLKYTNLKTEDQQMMFLVYLVSCFVPGIPHPIPILHGPQGAAKSSLFRVVKKLVDPSTYELLSFPKDNTELYSKRLLSGHF